MDQFVAPDGVFDFPDLPDAPVLRSVDDFIEWRAESAGAFDDWRYDAEKFFDAGANNLVAVTFHARGKLSGSEDWVEWDYGVVYTVEEGLITRVRMYLSQEGPAKRGAFSFLHGDPPSDHFSMHHLPDAARYCVGDVAGERRRDAQGL